MSAASPRLEFDDSKATTEEPEPRQSSREPPTSRPAQATARRTLIWDGSWVAADAVLR